MGGGEGTPLAPSIRTAARLALEFLLPRACVCCDRLLDAAETGLVCGRCWSRLALLPHPRCDRCGHPGLGVCAWCRQIPEYVSVVRSVCWTHKGTGARIVHALKYRGWHAVADEIADRLARIAWPVESSGDRVLVPVPLAPARERERGYNQSERIATALASRWRTPVSRDALERLRSTETQTRLTPAARQMNVSGAFRVCNATRQTIRDAHVVLVDDVVTTGATLNACAAALCEAGARLISCVTFGRAPAAGDRSP